MKKTLSLLVSLVMLLSLCACGNEPTSDTTNPSQEESTNIEENSNSTTESTQTTDVEETTVSTEKPATTPSKENNTKPTEEPIESNKPTESNKPAESSKPIESTKPVHTHSYSTATCTQPKKCSCGKTEGSALGHKWIEKTCTTAKTCSVCKVTEGSALGHKWQEATCKAPKTCAVCKQTEGPLATHIFKNGKCTCCQKDDIIELNVNLLQNETYISYKLIGNNELREHTLSFELIENNVVIFSTGEYNYYAEPDFDITNTKSVKYNGRNFYGGDGGFGGYWFVAKENTLEVFDEWNAWLYADSQSVATYVMQHNGQLRLVESKADNLPYLYEIKK